MQINPALSRRSMLGLTAAGLGATMLPIREAQAAGATPGEDEARHCGVGYGPLLADPQGLLDLPAGFSYSVLAVSGNSGNPIPATTLDDGGELSPGRYDGTGSFPRRRGGWVLVSNHENGFPAAGPVAMPVPHRDGITYDPGAAGGTTSITVDRHGRRVREVVSLAGTAGNCAGGVTPWGTWLTCEETEVKAGQNGATKDHGYVFEVRPDDPTNPHNAHPITAFGRYPHEAIVVDPDTGHTYSTEDAGNPNGMLYRWTPDGPAPEGYAALAPTAGRLEAMYCTDRGSFVPDLSVYSELGTTLQVSWKEVPDRTAATVSTRKQFDHLAKDATGAWTVRKTGPGGPITRSRTLEGMWWGDDGCYFDASYAAPSDGSVGTHNGQVWFLDPHAQTITLVLFWPATADQDVDPDSPDNITVSPYGGLVICEDGDGVNHLVIDDLAGGWAFLARNRQDSEMAGANFSANGRYLFANSQDPGVVFAIRGPWRSRRGHERD